MTRSPAMGSLKVLDDDTALLAIKEGGEKLARGGDGSRQSVILPVPGPSDVRSVSSNEPQPQEPDVSFQGADRTYNFYNCSGFTIN